MNLNRKYLKHHTYTDVVTFDLSSSGGGICAEIYISVDRIKENSGIFQTTISEELTRVLFHGVLHLCGYTDKLQSAQKIMRAREDFYLKKYLALIKKRSVPRETL